MERVERFFKKIHTVGVRVAIRDALRAIWPLWWSRDMELIYQIQLSHISQRIWRQYKKIIMQSIDSNVGEHSNIIWVCWLQGEENAPEIIKACIASMRKWAKGYEIRLITDKNLLEYVNIPEYIIRKYQEGKITFTHFSDILRTCLLYEHGGIWIDSTVLLTGELPKEITTEPFFMYQNKLSYDGSLAISSWLISANSYHPILKVIRDVLFAYWKNHNTLCHKFSDLDCLKGKNIFVTVDLDCLDTSIMPGTGTPEAGGMSFKELNEWFYYLKDFNIVGADVVELAPDYDASGASTAVATKVIRELLMAM